MPKIRATTLEDHNEAIWKALTDGLERLLAEKSYDQISFGDIATAAGIARNTVYNYAKDKAELVASAAAMSSQALLAHVTDISKASGPPSERLVNIFEAILSWFASAEHRRLVLRTLFEPGDGNVRELVGAPLEQIDGPVRKVLIDGIKTGDFRPIDDVELVVDLMAGIVQRAASRIVRFPDQLEPTIAEVIALVAVGVGNEAK